MAHGLYNPIRARGFLCEEWPCGISRCSNAGRFRFSSPDALLAYMVRTRVSQARASDDSNFFTLPIYPAPAAPTELGVSVTEAAIHLSWSEPPQPSGASADGYRVYRAEVGPGQESASQDVSQLKLKSPMYLVGGPSSNDSATRSSNSERRMPTRFEAFHALAQMQWNPQIPVPVIVTPRDTFPPDAPSGLRLGLFLQPRRHPRTSSYLGRSVPREIWPATTSIAATARYPGQRITNEILPSPAFRDISVVPGKAYFYRFQPSIVPGTKVLKVPRFRRISRPQSNSERSK